MPVCLSQKVDLELDYPTISALRNVNKTVWHEAANLIIKQSIEQVSGLLEDVAQDPDLKKIAAKVIKQSKDPDKRIIFIFLMERAAFPVSPDVAVKITISFFFERLRMLQRVIDKPF